MKSKYLKHQRVKVDSEVAGVICIGTIAKVEQDLDDPINFFYTLETVLTLKGDLSLLESNGKIIVNEFEIDSLYKTNMTEEEHRRFLTELEDCPTTEETLAKINDLGPLFTPEEIVTTNFAIAIENRMNKLNINQSNMSRKLKMSRQMVSKHLEGVTNYTVKTMVKLADAVDCDVIIDVQPKEEL